MSKFLKVFGKIALAIIIFFVLTSIASFVVLLGAILVEYGSDMGRLVEEAGTMELEANTSELFETLALTNGLMIVQCLCMIAAVWIMWVAFERRSGWGLGWKRERWFREGAAGSLWGIIFMTVCFLVVWVAGGIEVTGYGGEGIMRDLALAIVLFVLVGISEELLNRGYIQGLIRHHYGKTIAIAVTSLIFAAMHLANANVLQSPWPLVNLMLAGVLMGVAREVTGSLWAPIGIHFTWNLFQGNVYGFEVSGNDFGGSIVHAEAIGKDFLSGGAFGAEGSMITALILVGAILFMRAYYAKLK